MDSQFFESQRGHQGNKGDTGITDEANNLIRNGEAKNMEEALKNMMKEAKQANNGKGDKKLIRRIKETQKAERIRPSRNTKDRI